MLRAHGWARILGGGQELLTSWGPRSGSPQPRAAAGIAQGRSTGLVFGVPGSMAPQHPAPNPAAQCANNPKSTQRNPSACALPRVGTRCRAPGHHLPSAGHPKPFLIGKPVPKFCKCPLVGQGDKETAPKAGRRRVKAGPTALCAPPRSAGTAVRAGGGGCFPSRGKKALHKSRE